MTGYERLMAAMEGRPVDRTPFWPFVMMFAARFSGTPYGKFASDYHYMADSLIRTAEEFDFDAVTVDSDSCREASAIGAVVEFPENDLPIVRQQAITDKEHFSFPHIDVLSAPRLVDKIEGIRAVKEHFGMDKAVCGWIEAPLQSASCLYDLQEYLVDTILEPEFIDELLLYVTDLEVRFAKLQVEAGADIIGVGDATASLVSPEMYEEHFLSHTRNLVRELRKECPGVKLKYHICGKAMHLLQYADDIGFDVVNIDTPVNYHEALKVLKNDTCLKGNLSPIELLTCSPRDIPPMIDDLLSEHRAKFILSPGCEVSRDTPFENIRAITDYIKSR